MPRLLAIARSDNAARPRRPGGVLLTLALLGVALTAGCTLSGPSRWRWLSPPTPGGSLVVVGSSSTNTPPPPASATPTALPSATASPEPTDTPARPRNPSTLAARRNTVTPTAPPTEPPPPTEQPTAPPTAVPPPTATMARQGLVVGGIDWGDEAVPVDIVFPVGVVGEWAAEVSGLRLLVSDAEGKRQAEFAAIGSWNGERKAFVYVDLPTLSPVLSLHDGAYAGRPLEAEPLRAALEGPVRAPWALETIEANLQNLLGQQLVVRQGGRESAFAFAQAARMDAATVEDYRLKAGELSAVFGPVERPDEVFLLLICSARQPGEPNQSFPGRYLFVLRHVPDRS